MPDKKYKRGDESARQHEHIQILGELDSIDRAVGWLCNMVQVLENKIDVRSSAVELALGSSGPHHYRAAASPTPDPRPLIDADEHNYYARRHNGLAQEGDFVLMPLRSASNRLVSSFPRTLARLAFIYEDGELFEMLKCFDISTSNLGAHQSFCEFVGVNFAFALNVLNNYTIPCTIPVAEAREQRELLRAASLRYAVSPAPHTSPMIEKHNKRVRAANGDTLFLLDPVRDTSNLVVPSFPKDMFELFNPVYQMDVRFLLREYAQDDTAQGCERRWVEFVGVDWELRKFWLEDDMVFHRYTAV